MSTYKFRSHVRFSDQEAKRIAKMQEVTGLSAPTLLKKALFQRQDLERPLMRPEDALKLMVELNRQGNNLNQIARRVNEGVKAGWDSAFNSLTRAYVDLRRMLSVGNGRC